MNEPPDRPPSPVVDALVATILAAGYGAPIILGTTGIISWATSSPAGAVLGLGAWVSLTVLAYRRLCVQRAFFTSAFEVLALVLLPLWGLFFSHFLGHESCATDTPDTTAMRPFAEPEVLGLVALHAVTALVYAVSRKRPEALEPKAELLVHALLLAGAFMQVVVGVHVARWLPVGVLLAPIFLPCAGPWITVALYVAELRARLLRRGAEADAPAPLPTAAAPYREGAPQVPLPPEPRIHRPTLKRALLLAPALLGVHSVIQAVWLQRLDGAAAVFTRTCDHVLSRIPVEVLPADGHYLCTVAARGHRWLVRPERIGVRGGKTIVVNRQLALANAFEDLLHDRWPRFGRLARRVYDCLGLPVSRWIRRAWLADLVYLAMKPAEWGFYAALLLLDRGDPEARVGRMYRG